MSPTRVAFLAKKQITRKGLLDEAPPRQRRMDSYEDDFGNGVTIFPDDPYSKLAAWVKATARHHLPVKHPKTKLDVYVSAGLYQIVDLDQRNNLATVSAYLEVFWIDEFLKFNASDFDGINKVFVPLKWLWKPEFYMYHSVHGRVPDYPPDASAEIRSDGRVRMFVSISSKSFCPINFKRFPFDKQKCTFSVSQ
ncbi:hypothetical protein WR25_19174 [Diploscapter pachys]|uniref:Neurotransmitter-gated ion-channel ligand-binding domain-containing protein n=1 Tax=Diploscapter pachys TaxID=2018661 RepID=A0A2A2JFK5_9BILA|nr:hypothetical protein WR25_19174 [Diploscapter pachys]